MAEDYSWLFDRPLDERGPGEPEGITERLQHRRVRRYRVKTIKSGDVLECEIYPIWDTKAEAGRARRAKTKEAQRRINVRNARKRFCRLVNTNFAAGDLWLTLTYSGEQPDLEQARRDMQNYIRRVRTYRARHGLPELKYAYVIEYMGDDGRRARVHHHIIMSAMDRDAAESLWGKGRANADRLQPDDGGLTGVAMYMTKGVGAGGGQGTKRWAASRNLAKPIETVADHKVSKARVERLARDIGEAKGIFERLYRGYTYTDCKVTRSDFVAGAYIYVTMRRQVARGKGGKGGKGHGKGRAVHQSDCKSSTLDRRIDCCGRRHDGL